MVNLYDVPTKKSAMKCLLKFSKWFLPQEEKKCDMAIMVCPWFLLKCTTYKVGRIMLPMGIFHLKPTLQTKLLMIINTSAIHGSKIQQKKVAR